MSCLGFALVTVQVSEKPFRNGLINFDYIYTSQAMPTTADASWYRVHVRCYAHPALVGMLAYPVSLHDN